VIGAFALDGEFVSAVRWGSGHINDSYAVTVDAAGGPERYLVQRLNDVVFPDPAALMENVRRVTEHLRRRPGSGPVLTLVPTRDGGVVHRAFPFVEGAETYDAVSSPAVAREAARAFGRFQRDLGDLPGPRLHETIPGFHHTPGRFAALEAAVAADAAGRAREAAPEIGFARSREPLARVLTDAHDAGDIPERVIHGDTKINNVLFDRDTGRALCVIDLDTVMPGLSLYDFGGLVRTCVSPAAEDERDLSRIVVSGEIHAALVDGYLEEMGDTLTDAERDLLPAAGPVHTLEDGIRFLTDHLAGDVYYRIRRPGQNLDRARAQFALLVGLERMPQGGGSE
jgi:aminoglycoside phosphotransferase (APT) family kinase protein